jgi:hypothetical protein
MVNQSFTGRNDKRGVCSIPTAPTKFLFESKGLSVCSPEALAAFLVQNVRELSVFAQLSQTAVPPFQALGHSLVSLNSFFLYCFSQENRHCPTF